jgi:hypothetical protein
MATGFDLLPSDWREQAEELDGERAEGVTEQKPGVYDYTCPISEEPTLAIVLNEKGERRVFLLRNPVYAE